MYNEVCIISYIIGAIVWLTTLEHTDHIVTNMAHWVYNRIFR